MTDGQAASTEDPRVSAAFALGWHMSELYERHAPPAQRKPPDLPGLGSLSGKQRIAILIDQVEVDSNRLSSSVAQAGLGTIDLTKLTALSQTDAAADPVLATHVQLLGDLTAADPRLGKAYGLGRALADSCREPSDIATLTQELRPQRIANLLRWLDDLQSAFPPHAASSVGKSLGRWRDALDPTAPATRPAPQGRWKTPRGWWEAFLARRAEAASATAASADAGADATTKQMPVAAGPGVPQDAVRTLRRQGELWRALLSGEKQGTDMLEVDNYLDATRQLVSRLAVIGRGVVRRMPLLLALIVVLVGAGVWLLFQGGSSQLVGGVTSIVAGLGLTWKGIGGALRQLVGKLEQPLWGAVLDDAIADAITLLPNNSAEKGGRRQVALSAAAAVSAGGLPAEHG